MYLLAHEAHWWLFQLVLVCIHTFVLRNRWNSVPWIIFGNFSILSYITRLSYARSSSHLLLPTSYPQPKIKWMENFGIDRYRYHKIFYYSKKNAIRLLEFTWNSSPCFSLQYSFILGYTYSMSVLRSINMSVNVELVKIRTILELTGGKSIRLPANILSIVFSSMLCLESLLINGSAHKLLIHFTQQMMQNDSQFDIAD